eukprot:9850-Heterococcus_DN1.PRE.2
MHTYRSKLVQFAYCCYCCAYYSLVGFTCCYTIAVSLERTVMYSSSVKDIARSKDSISIVYESISTVYEQCAHGLLFRYCATLALCLRAVFEHYMF